MASRVEHSLGTTEALCTKTSKLDTFLAGLAPVAQTHVHWGTMPLRVTTYVASDTPPLQFVSSVRALVTAGDQLLVLRDHRNEQYILPGGRSEAGELPVETLRRELLEEIGIEIKNPASVGFLHFRHLGPQPENYEYPYPDFVQLVYRGELSRHVPEAKLADDFVTSSGFRALTQVIGSELPEFERPFLALIQSKELRGNNVVIFEQFGLIWMSGWTPSVDAQAARNYTIGPSIAHEGGDGN